MILIISSKNVYAAKRMLQEAKIKNEKLEIMDMRELVACGFKVDIGKFDVLYVRDPYLKSGAEFLPKIVALAKKFKAAGKKVVDSVIADGKIGEGKYADYQLLTNAGLPIPKTNLLKNFQFPISNFQPLILKWTYGFKGKHIFLVRDDTALHRIVQKYPADKLLIQKFIPAEFEYKIITVGYKALPVILRFKIKDGGFRVDFREYRVIQTPTTPSSTTFFNQKSGAGHPSLAGGEAPRKIPEHPRSISSFFKEEYPAKRGEVVGVDKIKKIVYLAEQSSELLKRELAKVDILESAGKFYVLEVNRFPGLKSFEELTKFNVTAEFLRYLPH